MVEQALDRGTEIRTRLTPEAADGTADQADHARDHARHRGTGRGIGQPAQKAARAQEQVSGALFRGQWCEAAAKLMQTQQRFLKARFLENREKFTPIPKIVVGSL